MFIIILILLALFLIIKMIIATPKDGNIGIKEIDELL